MLETLFPAGVCVRVTVCISRHAPLSRMEAQGQQPAVFTGQGDRVG